MDFDFYKLHTSGNDFILVNLLSHSDLAPDTFPGIARLACRRHTGIGANGIIFLTAGEQTAVRADFYDSRKSSVSCYDALTCAARYLFDSGMASDSKITLESCLGVSIVNVIDSRNFRVEIGTPQNADTGAIISPTPETDLFRNAGMLGRSLPVAPIRLSHDMTVVITEERKKSIRFLARELSDTKPNRTPVFVRTTSRDQCDLFTWRSAGIPDYSANAGGAVVAAVTSGFCDTEVTFYLRGHSFYAQWDTRKNSVFVTSPVEYVCSGSYYIDEGTG